MNVSEGTRFLYIFIFLVFSFELIQTGGKQKCAIDVVTFVEIWIAILLVWGLYLLLASLPKFREAKDQMIFRFADHIFGGAFICMFIASLVLYFNSKNDCSKKAKLLHYYMKCFLFVNGGLILAATFKFLVQFLKRFRTLTRLRFIR